LARFIFMRLIRIAVSIIVVSMITFALLQAAPGNFADIQRVASGATGMSPAQTSEVIGEIRGRYDPELPAWQQYLNFMKGAVVWDFGPSQGYPNLTVQSIIARAFPVTVVLATVSVAIAVLISVPLGVLTAVKQNTWVDYVSMFIFTIGRALPNYLVALFLILLFARELRWLPTRGWGSIEEAILPIFALTIGSIALLSRYVRSSMIDTLRQDYIMTVRAKGGNTNAIVVKHALRNSMIPFVTVVGPYLAGLMTGTVFIESIFGIPGLGGYFADAARTRDMPLLMGSTIFFALILMGTNLVVDIIYRILDPRIAFESGRK
jgi:peptide/nickel transport system permease protein